MEIIDYNSNFYPSSLKKIKNPPKKLYAIGNVNLLNTTCFSIVGSRVCSKYGMEMAKFFSKELSFQNLTIVSGMALGIDAISHHSTLNVGGYTIAVLGCGFNKIFPEENIGLYNKIIENNGLVISEYCPDEEACSKNFLARNRIVSGLSIGLLVVEAASRSGTSVTAKLAKEQGKKVFCIPHNIGDKYGVGINRLIKNGAIVITSPEEIINSFNFLNYKACEEKNVFSPTKKNIPKQYEEIYNILIGPPQNLSQICEKINKPIQFIISIISNLILILLKQKKDIKQMYFKQSIGKLGEDIACLYLEKNNYKIIKRNFRCKQGELDIIAFNLKKELIFIEVKTRNNINYGFACEAVNKYKKRHIYNCAKYYLFLNNFNNINIRFDIIEIYFKNNKTYLNHIKQAF